jgi:hypothetical protein
MSVTDLPTGLWLDGELRRLQAQGVYITLIHKGNHASGTILLQMRRRGGVSALYSQARAANGKLAWLPAFNGEEVADDKADAYIRQALAFDSDAWAVEIETDDKEIPLGDFAVLPPAL